MAKRTRSRSARRPGGQGPTRSKSTDASTSEAAAAAEANEADIDGAVEAISAEYAEVAIDDVAPAQTTKPRRTRRSARAQAESLEGRVAAENVYVRQDLRRIGIISVILLVGLAVAWIVFFVMDVLNLY